MSQTIKIKRSTATAAPGSLAQGELAYSDNSSKLFIGSATNGTILTIGGKLYVDMLDHTAGTLTASSAIIVDADSKIDQLKTANLTINGNAITSGSGDIDLVAAGNLDIDTGTVTFDTQATEFKIIDNSATALTITEGSTNYITIDTTNSSEKIVLNKQVQIGDPVSSPNNAYTLPTQDGTTGQALITNGSGTVAFTTISTTLNIAGDSGTDAVSLISDTFTFTGGEGIDTAVTDNTLTISAEDATDANKGVASFDSTDFTVSSGAVTANAITLGSSSLNLGETTNSLAGLQSLAVDNLTLDGNDISSTDVNGNITLTPNGTGVVKVPSGYKDRANFDADTLVPKSYVDAVQQGLDVKESVKVATTANLSSTYNNGAGTLTNNLANATIQIDNRTLSNSDRVLVKDQSTGAQNGIYQVTTAGDGSTPWVLTRSNDADTAEDLTGGSFTFVEDGDTNADNGYVFTHNGTPTLGTTDLTVSQFSGAGQITAGNGLTKVGNQIDVNPDNISIDINVDAVRIKGITATAAGDLIYGVTGNGGFASLAAPTAGTVTANDFLLSMDTSGNPLWANVLDGGTY